MPGYSTRAPTRIAAHIAVGNSPYALDFSPDGARAYVAASGSNAVVEIDAPRARSSTAAMPDASPGSRAFRPMARRSIVTNHDDATVSLFEPTTLELLATVNVVPHPEHIAVLPDSSKAFVSSGSANQISVIDLASKKLLANLAIGGEPEDLILKPDGGELYIPSRDSHGLVVVNTSTNEAGDFVLLGMSPTAGTMTPDGQLLYVSDSGAGHVVPVAIGLRQSAPPISVGQNRRHLHAHARWRHAAGGGCRFKRSGGAPCQNRRADHTHSRGIPPARFGREGFLIAPIIRAPHATR